MRAKWYPGKYRVTHPNYNPCPTTCGYVRVGQGAGQVSILEEAGCPKTVEWVRASTIKCFGFGVLWA